MSVALAVLLAAAQSTQHAAAQATVEPESSLAFFVVVPDPSGRVKVELTSFELTALGAARTEGRVIFAVRNPFAFPISVAAMNVKVHVNGAEIGEGKSQERKVGAKKRRALEVAFHSEKERFEAAAGSRWFQGASVPAELAGTLTLRINGKDVPADFHFAYPMGTDAARDGVFAQPPNL